MDDQVNGTSKYALQKLSGAGGPGVCGSNIITPKHRNKQNTNG